MHIVLQKSTPWVTSAFDDFIDISSSNLNKQKPAKKENSKVSWSRKSSFNDVNNSQTGCEGAVSIDAYFRSSHSSNRKVVNSKKRPTVETDLWSDKHAPKSQVCTEWW